MWSERNGGHTWSPPPKALRFLFVPTLILGGGVAVQLPGQIWSELQAGEVGWAAAIAGGEVFALFMVVAALFVLTARLVVDFDTLARQIHLRSTSLLWSKTQTVAFDAVTSVQLRSVRSTSNPHQVNPVGTFAMVLLVNPETGLRAQISSERLDTAPALAERVAAIVGVPVTRA